MIVLEWLFLTIAPCDAAEPWQLGSQDAATPMMQGIIDLHHDIFFFLILILVFVSRILVRALWHFQKEKNPIPQRIVHGTTIEILRTIFPSIIPMFIAIPSFALLYSMDEVVVNPAITIKAIGHQWYRSAPLHEGDLSATKCLKNMVREASGLPHRSLWFHLVVAGAVAYNFGPNGRPSNLSEWGIPVGNNHGSSCGTTGPGEDNLLFLLLFLRFGDGGPTVGNSRYKQLDRRGPALLLFHRGAVRSEKQGMSRLASLSTAHLSNKEDDYRIEFAFHGELVVPYLLPVSYVRNQKDRPTAEPILAQPHHPGCEPPENQAITASGCSSMKLRIKSVDKIEEGVRLLVEQRIRSCEGGHSKIVLFLYKDNRRSQRLGATLFLSYSSFFMISCRGEQTKQKRGPSQRKEKDLQRQRLLTLFLFLAVFYESGKPPQRDPQNRIENGG
ncbi:cytochrome c oxidase subunit 2 [Tanacetum coccineum]